MKYKLHYLILMTAILISPFTASTQPQESYALINISLNKTDTQVEVVLELSNKIEFESFTLFNPSRLVLDLLGVRNIPSDPLISVNSMGVKAIRTAKNQSDVARFIIDFEDTIPPYSIKQTGNNITIIITPEEEQPLEIKEPIIQEEKPAVITPVKETPSIKTPASKTIEQKNVQQPTEDKSEKRKEARKKKKADRESKEPKSSSDKKTSIAFGPQIGLYYLQSQNFKDIYGKNAQFFGAELDFLFLLNQNESIGMILSFDYLADKGTMTLTQEDVELTLLPLSFSAVYQRNFQKFKPYVALGFDYFKYQEILPETFQDNKITGFLWGFNFQLGTHFNLAEFLSLRAFFKYHVAKRTENDSLIDLSGFQLGLGILYIF